MLRGEKETGLVSIQSGLSLLHKYSQLFSFETSQGIQPILKKIMGLPQVLCCICHPCVDISFSAGHFKWSWASVLQQINGVHNVLHLPSSYHTVVEWLPRHNKIYRGKLSDFIARYEWKEGDFPGKRVIVSPQIYSLCLKDGHLLS